MSHKCCKCYNYIPDSEDYCNLCSSAIDVFEKIAREALYADMRDSQNLDENPDHWTDDIRPGIKDLKNKPRLNLFPSAILEVLAMPCQSGLEKGYEQNSWFNSGQTIGTWLEAMERHKIKYENGEDLDSETNIPHLYAIAWNAAVAALLLYYKIEGVDDRWVKDRIDGSDDKDIGEI